MEFLTDYGLFLAKTVTIVVAFLVILGSVLANTMKSKKESKGELIITHLNDELKSITQQMKDVILDKEALKDDEKAEKSKLKAEKKQLQVAKSAKEGEEFYKKRVYVIDFDGDMKASEVNLLRQSITAVLSMATDKDEVIVRLESPGGQVHGYGLAASQLHRIKKKQIPLTVCVDKVAASGGYLMACLADNIIAAPFAMIGSIGVIAQLPNFHRLLKKHNIDFEMHTAGEYKRTVTMFGENTDKDREKFKEELEDIFTLFTQHVSEHRPQADTSEIATGEAWPALRALEKKLVDEIKTSDECIVEACEEADVYEVSYEEKKTLQERLGLSISHIIERVSLTMISFWQKNKW